MPAITKSAERVESIRALLSQEAVQKQIALAAPKHMSADRFTRIAMTSIQRTPKLAECTPHSLLGALLTCSQLGLEPDDVAGSAYLVPYGRECTLIVGYKGLMMLARRSGQIAAIEARIVHAKDTYESAYGAAPVLTHTPFRGADAGPMIAVYAVARLLNGHAQFEWLWKEQVDAVRSKSQGKNAFSWKEHFNAMAKKTAVRRLCTFLPSSAELQRAVTLDDQAECGLPQSLEPIHVESVSVDVPGPPSLASIVDADATSKPAPKSPSPPANETTTKGAPPPEAEKQADALKTVTRLRMLATEAFTRIPEEDREGVLKSLDLINVTVVNNIGDPEVLDSIYNAFISAGKSDA